MKSGIRNMARGASVVALLTMLTACGGGDSPPTYTVGGTVTSLSGSGLVLQNEGGDDLPISASGAFTFATRMPSGTSYSVTVKTQPTSFPERCVVADGVGTIVATDATNVTVSCHSGTVSGLQGSGLVLQLFAPGSGGPRGSYHPGHNVGPPLQITSNGPFTFGIVVLPTAGLSVLLTQQPASPTQLCLIRNADAGSSGAAVTDVEVVCSQFSYVANATDNTVSAYTVDATSGALTAVGMVRTGTSPHAILGTPDKQFVFVANEASNDISAFTVNSATGALTAVPGAPFAAGIDPKAMALSPEGCLYVANAGSDTLSVYGVDPSSGALSSPMSALEPGRFATGKGPSSIAVANHIYVANNGGSNDISAFSSEVIEGACVLTAVPGSPFPVGANPASLVLGAGGQFLYTANPDPTHPSISGFRVDPSGAPSGALSPLSGSPFPLPVSHGIATDQTGAYLYVTSGASILGYAIDGTTGALTALPGFPVTAGANAYSIRIDPTNQFLYVTNDGTADVSGFRFDAGTGGLSPMTGSPFPAGKLPDSITVF